MDKDLIHIGVPMFLDFISEVELLLTGAAICYGPFVKPAALPAEYSFNNCSFIAATSV